MRKLPHTGGRPLIDLAGQRFGPLLVIERAEKPARFHYSPASSAWWSCSCTCGRERVLQSVRIRQGPRHCTCR